MARIALVAHDNCKPDILNWCQVNRELLLPHKLCATGTTGTLIARQTGLQVTTYESGPKGGDMQIGALIVEEKVDMLIFFWDPLTAQPHDPDVKALLRVAVLKNIPVANNIATADAIISGLPYMIL